MPHGLSPSSVLEAMAKAAHGDVAKSLSVARACLSAGNTQLAHSLLGDARELAPEHPEIRLLQRQIESQTAPAWHFRIVQDTARNEIYQQAIERAVTPSTRVLDIGAGSGLLSMMAARAGAKEVIACEQDPIVAEAARSVIRANGLADRIRVVAKSSKDLDVDADLGGPVDLIVSEILTNDLLGQDVLAVMDDVRTRLLAPGGAMIPRSAKVLAAPVYWPGLSSRQMDMISGFDLSAFNHLMSAPIAFRANEPFEMKSVPIETLAFDFERSDGVPPRKVQFDVGSKGGSIDGVLQWMRIVLDGDSTYDVLDEHKGRGAWTPQFFPCIPQLSSEPGDIVRLYSLHDNSSASSWVLSDTATNESLQD